MRIGELAQGKLPPSPPCESVRDVSDRAVLLSNEVKVLRYM